MKKSILIILFFVTATHCKAQTPIISLSAQGYRGATQGAYYKDTENVFSSFLGEWKLNIGTQFLKLKLIKKTMTYNSASNYYRDMIIGEYIYKENGAEKVNTLDLLSNATLDPYEHNISGSIVLHKNSIPPCPDCQPSEKRLYLYFDDPTRNVLGLRGQIELRRVDENGIQKLKMTLRETGNIILEDGMMPEFTSFNLPWGTYILTRP